ncbi:MAG: ATP-binding domain-containing protein [Methylotenera sp.]|nr:ATP-binding domain-containing protein [Methylotenera sp.]
MSRLQDSKEHIDSLAGETLDKFEEAANAASDSLKYASGLTVEAFAGINTLTAGSVVQSIGRINQANIDSNRKISSEPAIARVTVANENGEQHTYYVCRAEQGMVNLNLVSYMTPVGRLASLPPGAELLLPDGTTVEVLERAQLRPMSTNIGWDSIDSVIEGDGYGPLTIKSFRVLLEGVSADELDEDLVAKVLAEDSELANILEGIRHSTITKMELRDQPILDQYQDEIFRLPISSRLLILGPPGTGKTTTLIRRLGQKLNPAFLDEDENDLVKTASTNAALPHNQSWLMFTPTELLKQYVKEAFAREDVPAPEERIKTWSDYRHDLGRREFGILRTASDRGTFVLKPSLDSIAEDAQEGMIAWFEDFGAWHKSMFVNGINLAAEELSQDPDGKIAGLGQRLLSITQKGKTGSITPLLIAINKETSLIQSTVADLKAVTDKKIREALNLHFNRNKALLNELASFIDGLQEISVAEGDEADDQDSDEDEDVSQPKTPVAKALAAYNQAVRSQARAQAKKRSLGKNTRTGKILEWLGDRILAESDRAAVGASLLVQARARRFMNPVKKYIDGIPKRYRAFRRLRQDESKWYRKDAFSPTDLGPLELDVVLLVMLRSGGELLNVANIMRDIDTPAWSSLKPIHDLYRNQILVDEATDFSPVQIACMAALAHPRLRSFFACGDFNQRLTTWGSRSLAEMKWVFPEIEIKEITVVYRQSRQLNELAKALIKSVGGTDSGMALPEHMNNEGVPPVLAEGLSDRMALVGWLASRIQEIELALGQLPSIAILVNSEEEVQPVAAELNSALMSLNIRAVPCPGGLAMRPGNDVRVFDVQHIKGFEFEAVFFVGIDRLADKHPYLFDKYLYVGTTRAATYLGVTCEGKLPSSIAGIRSLFAESWAA